MIAVERLVLQFTKNAGYSCSIFYELRLSYSRGRKENHVRVICLYNLKDYFEIDRPFSKIALKFVYFLLYELPSKQLIKLISPCSIFNFLSFFSK